MRQPYFPALLIHSGSRERFNARDASCRGFRCHRSMAYAQLRDPIVGDIERTQFQPDTRLSGPDPSCSSARADLTIGGEIASS
jgi:hypothetical protein